jgi:hypothetical protein
MQAIEYHVPEAEQPAQQANACQPASQLSRSHVLKASSPRSSKAHRRKPQHSVGPSQAETASVLQRSAAFDSPHQPLLPMEGRTPGQAVQGQQAHAVDASMLRALQESVVMPFIPIDSPDVVSPRGMSTTAGVGG